MKKLLFIYIFFQFLAFTGNAQIKLIGNITTNGVANYPTHIDSLGKGGYMVMPTISGRDGIPTLRRKFGMLVFVQEVDSLYKLNSRNLDNTGWMALNVSSASDASQALAGKLNIADTTAMFANYARLINALVSDSSSLQSRFDLKLNAIDTLAIYNAIRSLNADTLSLGERITNLQNALGTTSQQISNGVAGDLATKVNYSDTAAMLANYKNNINSLIADTVSLANRINALTTSSGTSSATFLDSVNKRLQLKDTAGMLANYRTAINALIVDSNTLIARFANKLNFKDTATLLSKRDTASMLKPYMDNLKALNDDTLQIASQIAKIIAKLDSTGASIKNSNSSIDLKLNITDTAFLLQKTDTASLSSRIESANVLISQRLKITDTALMLSNRFARDTANLSMRADRNEQAIIDSSTSLNNKIVSNNILANSKLNISDTANMLLSYKRKLSDDSSKIASLIADTVIIARKLTANTQAIIDTALSLDARKLNSSDTAEMLSSRFARDTASLSNRINSISASSGTDKNTFLDSVNKRLQLRDTADMLANYRNNINALISDTVSLALRIAQLNALANSKLAIADTSNMLSNRFARDTASLSKRIDQLNISSGISSTIFLDSINKRLQLADTAAMLANYRKNVNALLADTATLVARFGQKLNITDTSSLLQKRDTAAMLSSRFARDTASLSYRISQLKTSTGVSDSLFNAEIVKRVKYSDTGAMLLYYKNNVTALVADTATLVARFGQKLNFTDTSSLLQKGDTAAMLSSRFARDTASLSNRINKLSLDNVVSQSAFQDSLKTRLQLADTANMLANYRNNINALVTDTGTLVARFGQKLNISDTSSLLQKRDTAAMLSNRFARDTASLSKRIADLSLTQGVDRLVFLDSVNKRLQLRDTAGMLTNYRNNINSLIADTLYLSNKIASLSVTSGSKLNTSDTSAMLANYRTNINALITDTGTLVARFGQKLTISDTSSLLQKRDTAAMLSNRFARDTASLSKRIDYLMVTQGVDRATFIDSVNKRLQIKDTAAMLANYRNNINSLIADTLYLSNKIAGLSSISSAKLNISDTASMLTNYRTSINALITDTSTLASRFGQKLNIFDSASLLQKRDTAAMLSSRFARDTASLSKRINDLVAVQGVDRLTFLDSVNKRLQLADTANMLANYRNNIYALINDTNTLATRFNNKLNTTDTLSLSNRINILNTNTGVTNTIFLDSINKRLQLRDTAAMLSAYQSSINALITDTNTLSTRFSYKLNITDTSRLLQKGDTITLSNRINTNKQAIIDSASALSAKIYANGAGKLNISDTAAMLSAYQSKINALIADTNTLSTRFSNKLNITDTANMLANYRTAINSLIVDTISLASRLATNKQAIIDSAAALNSRMIASGLQSAGKLNITDTANMLANYRTAINSLIVDTISLASRLATNKQAIIDSASSVNTKVNALIADTNTLKARFDAKLNFTDTTAILNSVAILTQGLVNTASAKLDTNKLSLTDTASMLLPYQTKINSLISDTNTLATRFGYKLNTSDTAAMLSSRFARDTASLSKRIDNITTTPIILGTTSMALGATISKVAGLSKISTDSLNIKAGAYNTPNAVLTTDGLGNASWNLSGLYSLNGINSTSQTFSTTSTGTTFNVISAGTSTNGTHTINIPLASTAGTTTGLISNADYTNFNRTDVTDETGIAGFALGTSNANGTFTYTLSQTPNAKSKVKMYINGVRISNGAYTLAGKIITYTTANNGGFSPSSTDRVQFDYFY